MPEFIYQFSSVPLFFFLNAVLLTISIIAISLVRRHVPLDFRYEENTAIVSCSALLGIIYAILIGFTILYQMNAFDRASKAENVEGRILYNIYRNATFVPEADAEKLRPFVLQYAQNAINNEWPALAVGNKVDAKGKTLIENMEKLVHDIHPPLNNNTVQNAKNSMIQDLNSLFEVRHERIAKVHTTLNGHMWFVLLLATMITLGINYFLGMDYRLHIFCAALISIVMGTILYLLVGLDRPYQGDFVVHPDSISSIIEFADAQGAEWAEKKVSAPSQAIYYSH